MDWLNYLLFFVSFVGFRRAIALHEAPAHPLLAPLCGHRLLGPVGAL